MPMLQAMTLVLENFRDMDGHTFQEFQRVQAKQFEVLQEVGAVDLDSRGED